MSLRVLRAACVLVLASAVLAAAAPTATAATAEERRLAQTAARIAAVRAELARAQTRVSTGADALAAAERRLGELMTAVGEAELAVERQQAAVDAARDQLVALEGESGRRNRTAAARVVWLYKGGGGAPLSALLASGSPGDAVVRSQYVDLVTRADRGAVEGLAASRALVDQQRRLLEAQEATLARVLEQQRAILADAEALRQDRSLQLAAARNNVDELRAQERHLQAESRDLAALARRGSRSAGASRASAPASSGSAPAPRGGWVFPARGRITSAFGPRWGRMHEGLDIAAPSGAPIYAARAGTVTYAGRMGGYGNIILIDHGGGVVTAYAHQSSLVAGVGQRVAAGEQIGRIGSTGNSTGPHVHFEVRVNGAPRNPRDYVG